MALTRKNSVKESVQETQEDAPVEASVQREEDVLEHEPQEDAIQEEEAVVQTSSPVKQEAAKAMTAPKAGGGVATREMEEAGFAGATLDWSSFSIVKLYQGEFCTGDGDDLGTDGFACKFLRSMDRFVFKEVGDDEDDDVDVFYTYDKNDQNTEGTEVFEKIKEWKEEGVKWEMKEYVEVLAMIVDPECELDGNIVNLQISPASKGKYGGYIHTQKWVKQLGPDEYLTKVSRGKKITSGRFDYYPWKFSFLSAL